MRHESRKNPIVDSQIVKLQLHMPCTGVSWARNQHGTISESKRSDHANQIVYHTHY